MLRPPPTAALISISGPLLFPLRPLLTDPPGHTLSLFFAPLTSDTTPDRLKPLLDPPEVVTSTLYVSGGINTHNTAVLYSI